MSEERVQEESAVNEEQEVRSSSTGNKINIGPLAIDIGFIIARVKDICLKPKETWQQIKNEQIEVKDFTMNFIAPLAFLQNLCVFIGMSVIGTTLPFVGSFRWPFVHGLVSMFVSFAFAVAGIFVAALVLKQLAPKFGGNCDLEDSLKLVGYSAAPVMLAGIFSIVPMLGILGIIIALYSIYIFISGVTLLTSVPETKKYPYVIVSAVAIIVVNAILSIFSGMFTPAPPAPNIDLDLSNFKLPS